MFKFEKDSVLKTPSREEVEKTEKFYRIKFPENYKFFGSRRSIQKQIGNAVPTLLGEKMFEHLVEHI